MSFRSRIAPLSVFLLTLALTASITSISFAGAALSSAVGGVSIDAKGALSEPDVQLQAAVLRRLRKEMKPVPGKLNAATDLRKVSLRALQAAIENAMKNNLGVLPDEVKYLAGIQRIQYVFVYPDQRDVVIAGPGEGWNLDEHGNVVGVTTRQPVLHLDDLLVALRSFHKVEEIGISCSIDPTAQGRQRMADLMSRQRTFNPRVIDAIEEALGPQEITLTGIPTHSRMARILVAADYRMKRIAMNLESSPVRGLPSYINMLSSGSVSNNMMPRWWLACNYQPMAASQDGLAWELRGPGVKCMTEEDFVAEDGTVKATGRKGTAAQRWADMMTAKYAELSEKEVVFSDLRNVMDLCVVAALIEKEGLLNEAGCDLSLLTGKNNDLMIDDLNPPKTIATQAGFIKKGRNYIITASGGVEVTAWDVASTSDVDPAIGPIRRQAASPSERTAFWWN